jgi:hypothetical protein
MKDKSYFIRKDIDTYKQKFFLLCNACFFEIKILTLINDK